MIGRGGGNVNLVGREITGNTGAIAAAVETDCSAVIGQDGKMSILQGGIIYGVQTLGAGKKATIRVYKNNGTWRKIDEYDITKDSGLEVNIGYAAHNTYMKITVQHDDAGNNRTFNYVFIVQDLVE